jgi:hypothetical protein
MSKFANVLNKYVAPFFVGVCMAAVTVVGDLASVVGLISLAGALSYFSFPAGGRMIARFTNAAV